MDNLKKRLSWLLVLMLVCTMLPASAMAAIPDGAPFIAITTDAGDAISVVDEGELTANVWGAEYVGSLYNVVIPEDATYADVTMNIPISNLVSYYGSNNVAGYYGDPLYGEESGGTSFEYVDYGTDYTVIRIPVEMSFGSLIKSEEDMYYAAGPEYGDTFEPICFFTFEYGVAGGEEPEVCEHTETTADYASVEGSEQHTITVTCDACGEQIGEATVADCTDADKNGKCDLCGGVVEVAAPAVPITKISFWDGRDQPYTELTISIGESVDAVACCTPKATTENVVVFSSSDSDIVDVETPEVTTNEMGYAYGAIKGVKAGTATLTAASKTNPEVYATCTITVACNHVGTVHTPSYGYEIVGGGVHNTIVNEYCECGELAKTGTVPNDECVDEDADGECDLCKGAMEETAEDVPAVIFDSSIHGTWGSPITFKKLFVSGVKVKSYEWNNGACIVTLDKNTPADAVMTFSCEGLTGGGGAACFYVNGSKSNYTAQLVNGEAVVEIRAASKYVSTSLASAKNISFITEGTEVVPVERIEITPAEGRVVACVGSLQLTANVYPENATVKDVKWSVSGGSTNITINETTGVVKGESMGMGGTYTVTATSVSNPEVTATSKVFVDYKPETGIELNKETMTVKIGEPGKLTATVTGDQFSSNKMVTWSSSDESIATVDSGNVTGLKTGTVTITATSYYGLTASCEVTVTCGHVGMETTMVYTQIEGTETHTAATTCVCGHVLGSSTEKCVDEDADGICDKCGGTVSAKEEPELEMGDVSGNGTVDANDAVLVLQAAAGAELTDAQKAAADMNKDGSIDANDAVLILQAAAKN